MKPVILAGNWKMHHGPRAAARFMRDWLARWAPLANREVWFFPPAASLTTVAQAIDGRPGLAVGAQHLYWEPSGAFTGEMSAAIATEAGATLALVGHSERRHVFGETDDDCERKIAAALAAGMTPVLCVGETLEEREAGRTEAVVLRQLAALDPLAGAALGMVVVAYEPVWAIGTGRTATPADADRVQGLIRNDLARRGGTGRQRILYGGSVKPGNVAALLGCPNVDGVLVGGASVDVEQWAAITAAIPD